MIELLIILNILVSFVALYLGVTNFKMHQLSKDLHEEAFSEISILRKRK